MKRVIKNLMLTLIIFLLLALFMDKPVEAKQSLITEDLVEIVFGECSWDGSQSHTTVTISLQDTKFILYGEGGPYGPLFSYHSGIQLSLSPGEYSYKWYERDPLYGIWINPQTGTFSLSSCVPQATAKVQTGACQWDPTNGPFTPVTIELDHAELTLNGTPYSAPSTTIMDLSPGNYSYSWAATGGYQGGESNLTLTIADCSPSAQVSHSIGNCAYENSQSLTTVSFNISGASVTLTGPGGMTYPLVEGAPPLALPVGEYTYGWVVLPHYKGGDGTNNFTLGTCIPAQVSYEIGECNWINGHSSRSLTFNINGASVTLIGPNGSYPPFTANTTFNDLSEGAYSYDWSAVSGYTGSGHIDLTLPVCEPGIADAAVNLTSCGVDDQGNPIAEVTITLNGAELSINNEIYTDSTTIQLPPGEFLYQWWAAPGFDGSGMGEVSTEICAPKSIPEVTIEIGACSIKNGNSLTEVSLFISGAELVVIRINSETYGPYTAFQSIELSPGEYQYLWSSTTGYEGEGQGQFTITACEQEESNNPLVTPDTTQDQPAGGSGPSILVSQILSVVLSGLIATNITHYFLFKNRPGS